MRSEPTSRRGCDMNGSGKPLLEIKDLTAGYGQVTVLWGVSLALREGEITALIGSNGVGKSTLMRTLSGLIAARSGQIQWRGQSIENADPADILALGIAHVPEGRRLFGAMSVEDNLRTVSYTHLTLPTKA